MSEFTFLFRTSPRLVRSRPCPSASLCSLPICRLLTVLSVQVSALNFLRLIPFALPLLPPARGVRLHQLCSQRQSPHPRSSVHTSTQGVMLSRSFSYSTGTGTAAPSASQQLQDNTDVARQSTSTHASSHNSNQNSRLPAHFPTSLMHPLPDDVTTLYELVVGKRRTIARCRAGRSVGGDGEERNGSGASVSGNGEGCGRGEVELERVEDELR